MQQSESWKGTLVGRCRSDGDALIRASLAVPLHRRRAMNFTDRQLQKCYDGNLAAVSGFPDELRPVYALIVVHELFRLLEGPHSPRVHETIEHLLLPKLRPALRCWYRRSGADTNPEAIEFRDHLSQLAGERLES